MNLPRPQMQSILALLSLLMFGLLVAALMFRVVPDQNRELVSTALGFLAGNMVGPAFQWFFGSTAGSERKTQALVAAAHPGPAAGTAQITAAPDVKVEAKVTEADDGELPADQRVQL